MRIRFISFTPIFIFVFLGLGLFNLEVIQGRRFKDLSNKNCIRLIPQMGARGNIFDRNNNIIVDNSLSYDVMIMPGDEVKINKEMLNVSDILDIDPKGLKDTYRTNLIAPFAPIAIAKNINIKKAIALEESKLDLDLSDIIIQPQPQRRYPYASLACHLLGYLNEIDHWRLTKLADYGYEKKDIVGFGGIEEKYDYYLRQEEGGLSLEVDHRGRSVRLLGFRPPKSGEDIQLTLDLKLQKIVEDSMGSRKGSIIIMDPYSGEIIAMASSPNFNPSLFINKDSGYIAGLFANTDASLINRSISSAYPAGSIFKLIVATAALETGKINLSTSFYCPGSIHVGKQEFSCWDTHNQQNLKGAITHSCNVFFYRTGLLLGAQLIHDYALKFGLSKPAGIDLPYETGGFIPQPLWKRIYKFQNWYDGDTVNFAIGQGYLLVTPLQMARMIAVFANNGHLVTPYIVKSIGGRDTSVYQKKITRISLKDSTVAYIREALRNVVVDPNGTANMLSTLPVSVAGKTGTAQVHQGQPHAWFIGFFPFKNPKFAICVFIEHGGSGYFSCVLTKQIIEAMIKEELI
jgi:penicillin-binding protein 2